MFESFVVVGHECVGITRGFEPQIIEDGYQNGGDGISPGNNDDAPRRVLYKGRNDGYKRSNTEGGNGNGIQFHLGYVGGLVVDVFLAARIGDENVHFIGKFVVFVVVFGEGTFDFVVGDFAVIDFFVGEHVVDFLAYELERRRSFGNVGVFVFAVMSRGNGAVALNIHMFQFLACSVELRYE